MTKNKEIYGNSRGFTETRIVPKTDSIVDAIIDEHIERAQMGKQKYGQTLDRTDLELIDYLQHSKEEAMDLALYLEKAIQIIKNRQ